MLTRELANIASCVTNKTNKILIIKRRKKNKNLNIKTMRPEVREPAL